MALAALGSLGGTAAERALALALTDTDAAVRMAAIEAMPLMTVPAAVSVAELEGAIGSTALSVGERQSAIAALGAIAASEAAPEATAALARLLARLGNDALPPALELDALEAARESGNAALLARLDTMGAGRDLASVGDAFPEALAHGGSAASGRQLVLRHPTAQCTRCHAIADSESDVGPPLDGIGSRLSRAELLESLVDPGATLADGFGEITGSASAMPPMGRLLGPTEIRDIVEFLATSP